MNTPYIRGQGCQGTRWLKIIFLICYIDIYKTQNYVTQGVQKKIGFNSEYLKFWQLSFASTGMLLVV